MMHWYDLLLEHKKRVQSILKCLTAKTKNLDTIQVTLDEAVTWKCSDTKLMQYEKGSSQFITNQIGQDQTQI